MLLIKKLVDLFLSDTQRKGPLSMEIFLNFFCACVIDLNIYIMVNIVH